MRTSSSSVIFTSSRYSSLSEPLQVSETSLLTATAGRADFDGSLSYVPTFTHSLALADEELVIIPFPVPLPVTASITVAASAVGGAAAAVDAQTVAVIGLVACARHGGEGDTDRRALSVVGLDGTCEGVLAGSSIAVVVVGFGSVVAVSVAHIALTRRRHAKVGSLANACALARAPHVWLVVCLYLANGFAVCGMELVRAEGRASAIRVAGALAFAFPVALVLSFPLITALLGTRRLQRVHYRWEPLLARRAGEFVFQSWALDPALDPQRLFGCVFGTARRLGSGWALVPQVSFLAALPMVVASGSACVPLFAISAVAYFGGSLLVVVARPRRVAASDALHALTLLVNGAVVTIATLMVSDPTVHRSSAALEWLGVAVTVLTVVRTVHSLSMILLALLLHRELVGGVEVVPIAEDEEEASMWGLQCALSDRAYTGLWWPVEKKGIDELEVTLVDTYVEMELKVLPVEHIPASYKPSDPPPQGTKPQQITRGPTTTSSAMLRGDEEAAERYLTEEQLFRREIAKDCARRQLEELLML